MNNYLKKNPWFKIPLILVPLVLILVFIIYPAAEEILDINKEITNERIRLEQKMARGLNIAEIKKDLKEIQPSIGRLNDALIKNGQELSFINTLEALAEKNGINIDINSDFTGPKIASSDIRQTTMQTNISGDYYQLLSFLRDVEKIPQYYNFNIIIASTKLQQSNKPMTMQLMGQIYIQEQ